MQYVDHWLNVRGISHENLVITVMIFVISTVGSMVLTTAVLVTLPADYLIADAPRSVRDTKTGTINASLVFKKIAGILLILVGLVMSVPGVPGQGLLTIGCGLLLLDLPIQRKVFRKALSLGNALMVVNRWRKRFGREDLIMDNSSPNESDSKTK